MTEFISIIINAVLGCTTLLGFICYYSANKRLKNSEVSKAETEVTAARFEVYEQRLEHCNDTVEKHNETIAHQSETIANLNRALDDKTTRIRQISDDLYQSEREKNDLNDKLVKATETIGKLNLRIDKLTRWKCHRGSCDHREPESPTIKNKSFEDDNPEI